MNYQPLSEINVTPFVDVMLVLLIVFMVTAPLLTVGVPVDLPKTKAKAIAETAAASPKDMGKVMKAAMAALAASGKAVDGKRVNAAARKSLGG